MSAAALSPSRQRGLLAVIFLLSLAEFLQSGMTAFAAQPIMGETGMAPEQFSLVAAAYASVAIFVISMQRWCVERIGGRRFVQACASFVMVGALVCANSGSFDGFLAGRLLMAVGGGAFFTSSRMVIHHTLAGPRRFAGIRALATGVAVGIAAAPWLAAQAVSAQHGSAIYGGIALLSLVIAALAELALPAAPLNLGPTRSKAEPWAQLLLLGASFALLYALQRLSYDYFGDVMKAGLIGSLAVAAIAWWLRHQRRHEQPLLRIRALLHARYLIGLALFGFTYLMLGANNTLVPQLLQGSLGLAWSSVGQIEGLSLAVALLTWFAMSRLLPRHPAPRKFLLTGFAALALFGLALALLPPDAHPWLHLLPALALNSVFLLTVLPVTAMQAFREVAHDDSIFSHAQQLKNMMSQAAIAAGITLATLGQQWRGAVHYTLLVGNVDVYNPVYQSTLSGLQNALAAGGSSEAAQAALARIAQMLAQQATLLAQMDHFAAVAVLGVVAMGAVMAQRVFR